ncbi:UDP binding domain-containing protein, partial [Vibrio parahaemolyticus]
LINELHQIFERMGIDTKAVIEAASTKWNFMKLMPGLVGGHCIGVDPYYLLHKSNSYGYIPDLMRTAREVNDGFSEYLANSFLRELVIKGINPVNTKVLLLGLSFKENCPDIRNTKVFDLYKNLVKLGISVDIYDPWVNKEEVAKEYGLTVYDNINELGSYDVGFLAVPHERIISDIREEKINLTQSYVYDYKRTLVD